MIETILFTIWLFLPAGIANMFATASRLFPFTNWLAKPVDLGKSYKRIRIFGDNKTFRGLIFGVIFGILAGILLKFLYLRIDFVQEQFDVSKFIDDGYDGFNIIIFSFLISFGALLGDMIKSFFKRRSGIKPGASFFPFDQVDYILGSILFTLLYIQLPVVIYLLYALLYFTLHIIVKYVGYLVGVDKEGF